MNAFFFATGLRAHEISNVHNFR